MEARRAFIWNTQPHDLPPVEFKSDKQTVRASWMGWDVMRFDYDGPAGFLTNKVTSFDSLEFESSDNHVVTDFGETEKSFTEMLSDTPEPNLHIDGGFSSNGQVYGWNRNKIRVWGLDRQLGKIGQRSGTQLACRQVYGGMSFKRGLLFDTDAGTMVVNALTFQSELVSPDENLVARAFNSSRFYDRTIWSVKADRVDITVVD